MLIIELAVKYDRTPAAATTIVYGIRRSSHHLIMLTVVGCMSE